MLCSCLCQPRELRLEEPPDFFIGEASGPKLVDGGSDNRLRESDLVSQLAAPRVCRYECAGAMAQLDDSFVLELAIRFGDGVWIDDQLFGQRTNAGQLFTG